VRRVVTTAFVVTALLVQVTIVNRIPLPDGRPDLVVLVVVALALVRGPEYGALVGFVSGLASDVVPPADHTLGRLALAYAVVGYAAGLLEDAEEKSVLTTVLVVAGASAVAVIGYAGIGALVGDERITITAMRNSLVATVIYDVVLAPFVVPVVSGAARRADPAGYGVRP
jgi:rod shape-determining protein MreD